MPFELKWFKIVSCTHDGEVFWINAMEQTFSNTTGNANWYNSPIGHFDNTCQSLNNVLLIILFLRTYPKKKNRAVQKYKYEEIYHNIF